MYNIDPVLKALYDIFNYGNQGDKLRQVRSFLGTYTYLNGIENKFKEEGTKVAITGLITRMVVDSNGKGYATILGRVLYGNKEFNEETGVYVGPYQYEYEYITDIAMVRNGVVYTWYPYKVLNVMDFNDNMLTVPCTPGSTYVGEKVYDFTRHLTVDLEFMTRLSEACTNGQYASDELTAYCKDVQDYVASIDGLDTEYWNKRLEKGEAQDLADVLDALSFGVGDMEDDRPHIDEPDIVYCDYTETEDTTTTDVMSVQNVFDTIISDLEDNVPVDDIQEATEQACEIIDVEEVKPMKRRFRRFKS